MKRYGFVLLFAFTLTSCMSPPKTAPAPTAAADIQLTALLNTSAKKTVTPDQVNDQNAADMAAALHVELNESQSGMPLPVNDPGSKK